jgi:hypothetical protein
LLAQMAGEVDAHMFGAFAAPPPWRQVEAFDEARNEAEDELIVIGIGKADMDIGLRVHFP